MGVDLPEEENIWTVSVRRRGGHWSVVDAHPLRSSALTSALAWKASGHEVLVRASTFLAVSDIPSQLALPGALVGRFVSGGASSPSTLSRRARARLRASA